MAMYIDVRKTSLNKRKG